MKKGLILGCILLLLTGCSFEKEETIAKKRALDYIEEKYGITNPTVRSVESECEEAECSSSYYYVRLQTEEKEFTVYISGRKKAETIGYDDYQKEEIKSQIESYIEKQVGQKAAQYQIDYGKNRTDGKESYFIHEKVTEENGLEIFENENYELEIQAFYTQEIPKEVSFPDLEYDGIYLIQTEEDKIETMKKEVSLTSPREYYPYNAEKVTYYHEFLTFHENLTTQKYDREYERRESEIEKNLKIYYFNDTPLQVIDAFDYEETDKETKLSKYYEVEPYSHFKFCLKKADGISNYYIQQEKGRREIEPQEEWVCGNISNSKANPLKIVFTGE